ADRPGVARDAREPGIAAARARPAVAGPAAATRSAGTAAGVGSAAGISRAAARRSAVRGGRCRDRTAEFIDVAAGVGWARVARIVIAVRNEIGIVVGVRHGVLQLPALTGLTGGTADRSGGGGRKRRDGHHRLNAMHRVVAMIYSGLRPASLITRPHF